MKRDKIIYWIATSLASLGLLMAGIMYFVAPAAAEGFVHLGFPDYFRKELGIAKVIGALVLLLPMVSSRIKEWAYAGAGIVYISALIAHISVDGAATAGGPVISMIILVVSYIYFLKHNSRDKSLDKA